MSGVFFDFDGTLVDTFDDIVEAVQRMRTRLDAGPLPAQEVKRHIGWGVSNLIAQCHPQLDSLRPESLPADGGELPVDAEEVRNALGIFREEYTEVMLVQSHLYAGIEPLCRRLAADGAALAVVSNKPERFVRQMLAGLGLVDPFALILGGETLPKRKPDPEPLRHAARTLGVSIDRCVMVGDSGLDIAAARAAGMRSCAVTWGLRSEEDLAALRPTRLARTPEELEACLRELLEPGP